MAIACSQPISRVRFSTSFTLLASWLMWSPILHAGCGSNVLTETELARVTPLIQEKMQSPIASVFGCALPTLETPSKETSLRVVSYSQPTTLIASGISITSRVVCFFGASVSCNDSREVLRTPNERDIVLKDSVPPADLLVLLAHLGREGVVDGFVASIAYVKPRNQRWSLREHGYLVVSRISPVEGLDYVFTYSCSLFRSCKWRERNRTKWFQPCSSVLMDSGCKFDNMPPNKAMHRKLDPSLRLATPSLSLASSSGDLRR